MVEDSSNIDVSINLKWAKPRVCADGNRGMEMLSATAIVTGQDELTARWHQDEQFDPECGEQWLRAVARQHRANFDLWHIEDEARRPSATDSTLADVKRHIDRTNQLRNDLAEELDRLLLPWLEAQGLPNSDAPLNSESPGLIIDRLSILSLKIYHTRDEAERPDASASHRERNRQRLGILEEQRCDLAGCLDALWRETLAGTRRFKLYQQLKMYNDPELNPAIYGRNKG